MLGLFTFYTYITVYLRDAGIPQSLDGAVLLVYGAFGVAGTLLLGKAYDRRPQLSLFGALTALLVALLALTALAGTGPAASVVVAIAVLGAGAVSLPVALQTIVLAQAGEDADPASSLYVSAFNLGIGGGALVGALVLSSSPAALPATALAISTVGTLIAVRRPRRWATSRRRRTRPSVRSASRVASREPSAPRRGGHSPNPNSA